MSKIRIINLLKNELSFLSAIYDDDALIELKNSFWSRVYYVDTPTNILNFLKKKSLNLSKTSIQTLSTNLQCTNKCNKVSFSFQK
jgi:hypothetical protein